MLKRELKNLLNSQANLLNIQTNVKMSILDGASLEITKVEKLEGIEFPSYSNVI